MIVIFGNRRMCLGGFLARVSVRGFRETRILFKEEIILPDLRFRRAMRSQRYSKRTARNVQSLATDLPPL